MTREQNSKPEGSFDVDIFPQGDGYVSVSFDLGDCDREHLEQIKRRVESAAEILSLMMTKVVEASNGDEDAQLINMNQLLFGLSETNDLLDQTLARVYYTEVAPVKKIPRQDSDQLAGHIAPVVNLNDYRTKPSGSS